MGLDSPRLNTAFTPEINVTANPSELSPIAQRPSMMAANDPAPSVAAAKFFWSLPATDNRTDFTHLQHTDSLDRLDRILIDYRGTDRVKLGRRYRLSLEALFSICINDMIRRSGMIRGIERNHSSKNDRALTRTLGASKHSTPLQTLYTGHLGGLSQRPEHMVDLPLFFAADVTWSQQQLADYALARPIHRLHFTSIPKPWLWSKYVSVSSLASLLSC